MKWKNTRSSGKTLGVAPLTRAPRRTLIYTAWPFHYLKCFTGCASAWLRNCMRTKQTSAERKIFLEGRLNPRQCMLQVSGISLQHMEKLKYLGGIHGWRKTEQGDWYTEWKSKRCSAWALLHCGHKTGAFPHRKACSFQINLCSDPHLNDWNNTISRTIGRYGIFAKSSRCDNLWQSALSKIHKALIVEPLLRIEISTTRVWPRN